MSKGGSQPTSAPQQADHSYDLVLDLMRERVIAQFDQVNALDSKANGVITAATTLLGAALVLQAAWLSLSNRNISPVFVHTQPIMIILLIIYALTLIMSIISGYWVQTFRRVPEPNALQEYALKPQGITQSKMVGTMAEAFDQNKKIISFKVWSLRIATSFLLSEVIVLAVLLSMQIYN